MWSLVATAPGTRTQPTGSEAPASREASLESPSPRPDWLLWRGLWGPPDGSRCPRRKALPPREADAPRGGAGPPPLVPARAAASHPRSALTTRARGLSRSPRSTTPMASPFSRCTLMVLVASHVQNSVRLYTSMLRSCGCLSGLWCGLGEVRTDGCKTGGSEHRLKGAAGRARPQRPREAEGRGSNLRARLPPHARWGGPRTPERPRKGPGPSLGFRAHPSGPPPDPAGGLRDRPLSGSSSGSCRCTGTTWRPSSRARAGGPFSGLLLAPCSFRWPHALDHDPQILFVCLFNLGYQDSALKLTSHNPRPSGRGQGYRAR